MSLLSESSEREIALANGLRTMAVARLSQLGTQESARRLGLAPGGVESLLWRELWSLETAYRVAEALGLDVIEQLAETLEMSSPR